MLASSVTVIILNTNYLLRVINSFLLIDNFFSTVLAFRKIAKLLMCGVIARDENFALPSAVTPFKIFNGGMLFVWN